MPIIRRSLFESVAADDHSVDYPHAVFVTGKGGTGKSTIASAFGHAMQKDRPVRLVDIDGAHSALDSFGEPEALTDAVQRCNDIVQLTRNLQILLLNSFTDNTWSVYELDKKLARYIPDEGVIPVVRLAAESARMGLLTSHDGAALILQLIELFENSRYFRVDTLAPEGEQAVRKIDLAPAATTIVDTENSNNLIKLLSSTAMLETTLKDSGRLTRHRTMIERIANPLAAIESQVFMASMDNSPNLAAYGATDIARNFESGVTVIRSFIERIRGTRTKLVVVLNPDVNEVHQTARELVMLAGSPLKPAHIVVNVNRPNQRTHVESHIAHLVEAGKDIDATVGIGIVDPKGMCIVPPDASENEQRHIRVANLEIFAEQFGNV